MTLAVYTTIYPAVESYLVDWYRSLRQQSDQDFDLWIGLDGLDRDAVRKILGSELEAKWVEAPYGVTPAQIRQDALARIVEAYSEVVLVDSDDLLHPTRVAAARAGLESSQLAGCALCLINQRGESLGRTFGLPTHLAPEDVFPRNNIFGFSNSAFRSELLRRCLPIPADAVLVDWFLATKAWLLGAKLSFDPVPRMDYRQYLTNTARVLYPIAAGQIISDTARVRRHFQLVLAALSQEFLVDRVATLRMVAAEMEEFYKQIVLQPARLEDYTQAFNALHPALLWWTTVAYPGLGYMWKPKKG
ncbi:MAG TPA: glycosyltransferase family 2 protein [Terracidiphilus sp.]|jgi:hypothetical protein